MIAFRQAKLDRVRLSCLAFVCLGLLLIAACAPRQLGGDQCPDINVNLTAARDQQHVGNNPDIDQIMNDFIDGSARVPGCAIGIMKDNEIFYLKGYGSADLGNLNQNGDETPWGVGTPAVVGSISKTLTALAIMRLQEMGYLSIDDPVNNYVGVPGAWQGITIKQLLAHTSGMTDFPIFYDNINTEEELSEFLFPNLPAPIPNLGIFPKFVYPSYLDTPKGDLPNEDDETASYSNTGYMILGTVIEHILEDNAQEIGVQTYERFVWREVGFFDQSIQNGDQLYSMCLNEYWRQDDIPNLARGYSINDMGTLDGPITFMNSEMVRDGVRMSRGPAGWEGPAGGWTMTIGDLVRLMMAIENNSIVSAASRDQMLLNFNSPTITNRGYGFDDTKSFGLGLYRAAGELPPGDPRERLHYMHDGDYPGYAARYTVWPNENFGVAVMCNGTETNVVSPTIRLASLLIDQPAAAAAVLPQQTAAVVVVDDPDPGDDPGLGIGPVSSTIPGAFDAKESAAFLSELDFLRAEQGQEEMRQLQASALACDEIVPFDLTDILDTSTLPGQIALCADTMRNHGQFMQCVAGVTREEVKMGMLSGAQKGRVQSCAALSNVVDQ